MVELKDSRTVNGFLETMDRFMNLKMKSVIITMPTGNKFFKQEELFIRGNNVKHLRIVSFNKNEQVLQNYSSSLLKKRAMKSKKQKS